MKLILTQEKILRVTDAIKNLTDILRDYGDIPVVRINDYDGEMETDMDFVPVTHYAGDLSPEFIQELGETPDMRNEITVCAFLRDSEVEPMEPGQAPDLKVVQ